MAEFSLPTDLNLQWASSGDVLKPTDTKIQQGWQPEIPARQWFNWLDNRQDQAIAHIAQHGIAVWSSTLEYQAGKSYVQGSDGLIYKARTTHTNVDPTTDSTFVNWTRYSGGSLLNVQRFTANGTYTPTPGTTFIIVEVQAGGGGGGGAASSSTVASVAGGGGAGAYGKSQITSGFSSVAVSVGAGGAGGAAGASGTGGGTSSFGSMITCVGGSGGFTTSSSTVAAAGSGSGGGSSGGNLLSITGAPGLPGYLVGSNAGNAGNGGASVLGSGGRGAPLGAGVVASGFGGGGGGALSISNSTGYVGGAGTGGVVIVWEYS